MQNKLAQAREIIRCGKDPNYFIRTYAKIQHPQRGLVSFEAYPFQETCIDDFIKHRFNVILKSRQMGISSIVAAYATWMAIFHRDKNILVIATKLDVAMNFIAKVKVMIRNLPKWLVLPTITVENKQTLEFSHGSKVKAIPTSDDAGRSEALSLLIVDEAAFVRNFDVLWAGLYPSLSTGGNAIVLSTPNGVGGQYHKLYTDAEAGLNEFNAVKLMWYLHPERDEEWFTNETKGMSKRQIAQELLCDFASSGETFLAAEEIEWLGKIVTPPIDRYGADRNVWIWKTSLSDHKYIISADVARGDSADYSTFHVIDIDEGEVVAEYKGKIPPDRFGELLFDMGKKYCNALLCPENNSFGYATILKLQELRYPRVYVNEKHSTAPPMGEYIPLSSAVAAGFNTNGKSRLDILTKLGEIIRNKQIKIYSSRFYDELKTFVWSGSRAQAMKGHHDDLVLSLAIGCWLFDVSGCSKDTSKLNEVMLGAMGTMSQEMGAFNGLTPGPRKEFSHVNRFAPLMPSAGGGDSWAGDPKSRVANKFNQTFDWMFKK